MQTFKSYLPLSIVEAATGEKGSDGCRREGVPSTEGSAGRLPCDVLVELRVVAEGNAVGAGRLACDVADVWVMAEGVAHVAGRADRLAHAVLGKV